MIYHGVSETVVLGDFVSEARDTGEKKGRGRLALLYHIFPFPPNVDLVREWWPTSIEGPQNQTVDDLIAACRLEGFAKRSRYIGRGGNRRQTNGCWGCKGFQ